MPAFGETPVGYELLGPAPGQRFSAIYYTPSLPPQTGESMASVNAGDPRLYVGGGTLNAQFGRETPEAGAYAGVHQAMLERLRAGGGPAPAGQLDLPAPIPVRAVLGELADGDTGSGAPADGSVFLDVFAQACHPHGFAENAAMLYVVPPFFGHFENDDAGFLAAVREAAARCVRLIGAYNRGLSGALAAPDAAPIRVLRMALFSGGVFKPANLDRAQVAAANVAGLQAALAAGDAGLRRIEFESAAGEFAALADG